MGIGLGDVTTVFAILIALGIVFPGLLLAWSLLVPGMVERSRERLTRTPWKSFILGILILFMTSVPIAILNRLSGPFQFFAYVIAFTVWTCASIGAAGLASLMGERLRGQGVQVTSPGALVRGAISLEFAIIFPIIGWFIVLPLTLLVSLGASIFALLHWTPRLKSESHPIEPPSASLFQPAQSEI